MVRPLVDGCKVTMFVAALPTLSVPPPRLMRFAVSVAELPVTAALLVMKLSPPPAVRLTVAEPALTMVLHGTGPAHRPERLDESWEPRPRGQIDPSGHFPIIALKSEPLQVTMATGLRERKKQRLRRTILETAVDLFRERGFDETRVQDILEGAEISLGTFYNYFPGKDAVLDEFGRNLIASYVQLAAQELAHEDHTVDQRVRALARACGRAFSSDPEFMTVVVTRSRAFGGQGQLPARDDPIYGLLARQALRRRPFGRERDRHDVPPIELAETFGGIFMFTVVSWLAERQATAKARGNEEADLDARLMRSFDVFLDGSNQR